MKHLHLLVLIALLLLLAGCAEGNPMRNDPAMLQYNKVWGFWGGLIHGLLFPLSWLGGLFSSDINVYAVYNNGGWYNFGYLLGLSSAFGGGSSAVRR